MNKLLLIIFIGATNFINAGNVTISLQHFFASEKLLISDNQYQTSSGDIITINKFRYYIGNIVLSDSSGIIYKDSVNYHLIDLENPESMILHFQNIPEGVINKIEFGVGVDSLTNSNGLMDGDLDPLKGMYWAWSSGFINFKLEGEYSSDNLKYEFNYHIGGFISPNETYQKVDLAVDNLLINESIALEILVDINVLFSNTIIIENKKIMSPSLEAKRFATLFPQLFSIKQ